MAKTTSKKKKDNGATGSTGSPQAGQTPIQKETPNMNLDQALEILTREQAAIMQKYDSIYSLVDAAQAAQAAEMASRNAVQERGKIEKDLEAFKASAEDETKELETELQKAHAELQKVQAMAIQTQDKQRQDYAKAEQEQAGRVKSLLAEREKLLSEKRQVQQDIDDLKKQKAQLENVARSMLHA